MVIRERGKRLFGWEICSLKAGVCLHSWDGGERDTVAILLGLFCALFFFDWVAKGVSLYMQTMAVLAQSLKARYYLIRMKSQLKGDRGPIARLCLARHSALKEP